MIGGRRYRVLDSNPLGEGNFGKVFKACDTVTQELVVVKVIPREKCKRGYITTEMLNHSQLNHPFVIGFRSFWVSNNNINVVMELATAGTLFNYVNNYVGQKLTEEVARYFFQQLVLAVDYCHKKGVANRDIKLENLLLQQEVAGKLPVLKLCDWGYSRDTQADAKTAAGTLHYMSPQPLRNFCLNVQQPYTATAADVWSCGVCLYAMLTRRYPFSWDMTVMGHREAAIMLQRMQAAGEPGVVPPWDRPEATGHLSAQVKELLAGLLAPDEAQRLTVQQIADNKWFRTNLDPQAFSQNDVWVTAPLREGLPSAADIEACMIAALGPEHGTARR